MNPTNTGFGLGHPSCLDMTMELVSMIKTYPWQCMECKTCIICGQPHHEEEMMFCDMCDRGYHTFCVGLGAIPSGKDHKQEAHDLPWDSPSIVSKGCRNTSDRKGLCSDHPGQGHRLFLRRPPNQPRGHMHVRESSLSLEVELSV